MAWIESHQGLGAHPKTLKLARLLNISRASAVGHLHYLWWWALDYAPDGNLDVFDTAEIAAAGAWDDAPDLFDTALINAGFLDEDHSIHDWMEYAGRLIESRKRKADSMRRQRDGTLLERNGTLLERAVTNRTQPNRNPTVPNPTKDGVAPEPDWYSTLYQIKGFTLSLDHCQSWLDAKGITTERADEVAFSVKSKWPGPKARPYIDPWATFQGWVKRPPLGNDNQPKATTEEDPTAKHKQAAADIAARRESYYLEHPEKRPKAIIYDN